MFFVAALPAQSLTEAARAAAAIVPPRSRVSISVEARRGVDADVAESFRAAVVEQMSGVELAPDGQPYKLVVSENVRGLVGVAQFRERTAVVAFTMPAVARSRGRVTMTLLRSQADPILDALVLPNATVILEPARLMIYEAAGSIRPVALTLPSPMPRDPRGRLTGSLEAVRITTPAGSCGGAVGSLTCSSNTGQWVAGRNYQRDPALGEFYSVALLPEGRTVTTPIDGDARGLGSDVTGIASACGVTWIATSTGEPDSLTGMTSNGAPGTEALLLGGAVTALWPSGTADAVHAVVRSAETGKYELYRATIDCPR